MPEVTAQALNYHTTNLFVGRDSDAGAFSIETPSHVNFPYHQIVIVASGAIATGTYKVRLAFFEGDQQLEYTVDSGKTLAFSGGRSAIAYLTGPIRGIHLEVDTALSSGETISCVLSSSKEPLNL